ncbi:hypothetical protein AC233_01555 [Burkholderia sp. HB1]|nr:hypothetical protein AC233_01555 [Burkholderia sp. HB1]
MGVVLAWSPKYTRSLPSIQRQRPLRPPMHAIPSPFSVFTKPLHAIRARLSLGVAACDAGDTA